MRLFRRIRNQFNKEMRAFYKMNRKHRKETIKLAKEYCDWDWSYFHDLVITKIRHMYEYYSAGNNVWQGEESLNKVLSTLKEVIDLDKEWDDLWEKCYVKDDARMTVVEYQDKQEKIVQELYSKIGQNMFWWWD